MAYNRIDKGPSKLDLMLALFDTDFGVRTVKFRVLDGPCVNDPELGWYDVQIISARRRHRSAAIWDIEGIFETRLAKQRVSIYYLSDTREGSIRFEGKPRTQSIDDSRQAKALMVVIRKMIAKYQNSHGGNLDDEIFRLFEKAKRIHYAEDSGFLTAAIKNV